MNKCYGMLGISAKAGKLVSGFDAVVDGIKKNQVKLVILANDISDKTKKEIEFTCEKFKIPLKVFGTIEQNSHAIGKKNRAIIGIADLGLAMQIQKIIDMEVPKNENL